MPRKKKKPNKSRSQSKKKTSTKKRKKKVAGKSGALKGADASEALKLFSLEKPLQVAAFPSTGGSTWCSAACGVSSFCATASPQGTTGC